MDELLRYYEEELGVFGQFAREFRARYPKPAGELHLSGETIDDPGVLRLIQSVALLTARIRKRLDDDYPQFTEALLDSLYPHYLRPLPSHTIVQVGWRGDAETAPAPALLPRGTMLRAGGNGTPGGVDGVCRFRTCYDVLQAPFAVRRLAFAPLIEVPRALRLPRGVASCISIVIGAIEGAAGFAQMLPARMRLFVDGDPSLRAAFLDAVFLHCGGAWLQAGDGPWRPLARLPLRAAGFAEEDAMLPFPARSHPALRLLTEYFCYPDKFHFVDLDLDELRAHLAPGCTGFTVHLGLRGIAGDGDVAHLLAGLNARNLLPGCTPAVNLFPKAGAPLLLSGTGADHPLLADSAHAAAFEIFSVDAVRLVREGAATQTVVPFAPLYEPMPGTADPAAEPTADRAGGPAPHWWIARRDHATAAISPGHEMRIALLDREFAAVDAAGATLSTELTCTNRDLPARLPWGQADGDLRADALSGTAPIRMLRKPSPGYRFDTARGAHWRLIAHLAPHPSGLCTAGLAAFQQMLALYDLPRSAPTQRAIAGIVGLESGAERTWLPGAPVATLMPGIAIRLTVDDEAFAGSSVAVFAHLLDRYFALNAQLNCYTRLCVVSRRSGQQLLACAPRLGAAAGTAS
jgi:type VI secretion system protein ImpG